MKYEPNSSRKDSVEAKMEEMTLVIKNVPNKIAHLETKGLSRNPTQQPKNQNFMRRQFNPQIMQRDKIMEEQPIQPPTRMELNFQIDKSYDDPD